MSGMDALLAYQSVFSGLLIQWGCSDHDVLNDVRALIPGVSGVGLAPIRADNECAFRAPWNMVYIDSHFAQYNGVQGGNGATAVGIEFWLNGAQQGNVMWSGDIAGSLARSADGPQINAPVPRPRKNDVVQLVLNVSQALGAGGVTSAIDGWVFFGPDPLPAIGNLYQQVADEL